MSTPETHSRPDFHIIDPTASVRAHPDWFFRSGEFSVAELLSLLTHEAIMHGARDVTARAIGEWWLIQSSHDWLSGDIAAFFNLVPDPLAGPNSSRVEFLATVFCRAVWTARAGEPYAVAAVEPLPPDVLTQLSDRTVGRSIAFLPPESSATSTSR